MFRLVIFVFNYLHKRRPVTNGYYLAHLGVSNTEYCISCYEKWIADLSVRDAATMQDKQS